MPWVLLLVSMGCFLACSGLTGQKIPKKYVSHKAMGPIAIDGQAKEESWEKAPWSDDFIDIEGDKIPTYRTRMKMLWDDSYLYFYAEMEEPHVWGTLKQRDTVIFYNNDFEIFIDPDGDTHGYMEFEMNALNTQWDLFLTKPYRNGNIVLDSWDITGLKTAVHIDGSLNDSRDFDRGWSVEIAFPWNAITEAAKKGTVPLNEYWRINFSRVNWDFELDDKGRYSRKKDAGGTFLPEYNWVWSPQWVINMHEPEHWGYVYFTDAPFKEKPSFEISPDDKIKYVLYGAYRKLLQSKDFGATKKTLESTPLQVEGDTFSVRIEEHKRGWNLITVNPLTGNTIAISEDGKFKTFEK
ncbi:MAG: carbohydrate-binding family 9-like protein [Flavobacteriaceae bacterium]